MSCACNTFGTSSSCVNICFSAFSFTEWMSFPSCHPIPSPHLHTYYNYPQCCGDVLIHKHLSVNYLQPASLESERKNEKKASEVLEDPGKRCLGHIHNCPQFFAIWVPRSVTWRKSLGERQSPVTAPQELTGPAGPWGFTVTLQRGAMGEERGQRQIFARGMNRPSHMQLPSDGRLGLGMRKVLQVVLSRAKSIG